MPSERITEELVLSELGAKLGSNSGFTVYEQGSVESIAKLDKLLQKAGGKPAFCELSDLQTTGPGKAKPEFIITFDKKPDTVIVFECKKTASKHQSEKRNKPKDYAVDGVLYYAKFLKQEYNVIAVAVSGTKKGNWKVTAFDWRKGQAESQELPKGKDILYSPENYLRLISGEQVRKAVSIVEVQKLALEMHDKMRKLGLTERKKPIFIAGILIALKDKDFSQDYTGLNSFDVLLVQLQHAIDKVLEHSDVHREKREEIKNDFKIIGRNSEIKNIPLGKDNSLLWYVSELDRKIKPMMDNADSTVDALGIFYHEFVRYGGDGGGLGIVLTPQHLTEFMVELSGADKNSRVVDICCGSGAFLVTAMSKMFKGANVKEIERIRKESLYGVEKENEIYALAVANMIVRGDGKSNIFPESCFKDSTVQALKDKHINVGLLNPPYSQKGGTSELEFVEHLLNILTVGGTAVVVVPMSCAIGTKHTEVRERLFKKHTLQAVFSMPDDVFYGNKVSTNVCVMVWKAHSPHNSSQTTFFGYYKDDGFVKAKKLGRIDKFNRWESIKSQWLELYREREVRDGLTAKKAVDWDDEWLCEAYMGTDYSTLSQEDFENTVRKYLSHLVLSSKVSLDKLREKNVPIPALDFTHWKQFKLSTLFKPERGKRLTKENRIGGNIPLATAGFANEGIAEYIANEAMKIYQNVITIDMFCNCFYRGYQFACDDNILVLHPLFSGANPFNMLFLITVIYADKYRYAYGRQYRQKDFYEHVVQLPVTPNGLPDWQFMKNYIKSLPYSDRF
ncbi:hypothetical protein FACS189419_05760 [Planctomycetales bacterium]|nr:hypothetical protein FACS189419_05760 [Planctomycetales bacterium]